MIGALFFTIAAAAQLQQETITYSMKMDNSPVAAMLGDMQLTLYYKNGKSLTDITSSMYSMKALVTDTGTLTLMNTMGQKFYFQTASPSLSDSGAKAPKIKYTSETKQIAGYTCTKALIFIQANDAMDTAIFWYTEKLPVVAFGKEAALFKDLKGMPLEYEIKAPQMTMTVTAQKVSLGSIPDSTFVLSTDGYTKMDMGDMMKQFQQ